MTEIPDEFSLPRAAFERQRSMFAAHVEGGRAVEPRRGRRFALAVVVATFAVVVTAATALGVRAFILDKGFVGLPPRGRYSERSRERAARGQARREEHDG